MKQSNDNWKLVVAAAVILVTLVAVIYGVVWMSRPPTPKPVKIDQETQEAIDDAAALLKVGKSLEEAQAYVDKRVAEGSLSSERGAAVKAALPRWEEDYARELRLNWVRSEALARDRKRARDKQLAKEAEEAANRRKDAVIYFEYKETTVEYSR